MSIIEAVKEAIFGYLALNISEEVFNILWFILPSFYEKTIQVKGKVSWLYISTFGKLINLWKYIYREIGIVVGDFCFLRNN